MWRFFQRLLPSPRLIQLNKTVDFTQTCRDHWAGFDGGDNWNALFTIRGMVTKGDSILVRMQSGRIGRYYLFSVIRDFSGVADWKAHGIASYYHEPSRKSISGGSRVAPKIAGLLGDGGRGVQPDASKLAHIPSGFTEPTSDFWKILVRDEACRDRASSLRAAGNLRLGQNLCR